VVSAVGAGAMAANSEVRMADDQKSGNAAGNSGTIRSKEEKSAPPKEWSEEEMRAAKPLPLPTVPDNRDVPAVAPGGSKTGKPMEP
jgi:hypothetical protein